MLARNAFGNYRDLIEDVTLHPAMGVYLSMLGNENPDPVNKIRPDENYARELQQTGQDWISLSPRTVMSRSGFEGSFSILERSRLMWTSRVLVSPT